jgi:hypothetical protein
MRLSRSPLLMLAFPLACGTTEPVSALLTTGEGTLSIQTSTTVFTWPGSGAEVDYLVVTATVTNTGSDPVYARLGDAFNSADEQERIFAAIGSDGRVERQAGDSWLSVTGGILVEGVKTVVLMPGESYALDAIVGQPRFTGTARIRIAWFDSADDVGNATPHEDFSNTFEIR